MLTFSADFKGPIHESKQLRQKAVVSGVVLAGFSMQMLVGSVFHRYKVHSLTVVPCWDGNVHWLGWKSTFPRAVAVALGRMFGDS